jgi:hypothetical protein
VGSIGREEQLEILFKLAILILSEKCPPEVFWVQVSGTVYFKISSP